MIVLVPTQVMPRRPPAPAPPPVPDGGADRPAPPEERTGRPAPQPAGVRPAPSPAARPNVIVDFHVERGILVVALRNIGAAAAYGVVTRFDQPFRGLGGTRDLSTLTLFRALPFLAPGRQLCQMVDPVHAYFRRGEPRRLAATITYTDRDGHSYTQVVPHDLDVYRELAEAIFR